MFSKLKSDLPAGIVVFLVALPLCLGIALASGAPLLSGIISGIIGGLVVGILSQSHTSVSGPAAGLAAVVLAAIATLGSFEAFLLASVIAGAIQLVLGVLKGGFIANYIPSNVIKGLLAAIGIILILKQIPHAIGKDTVPQADFAFLQTDGENTFSALLNLFNYYSFGAMVISALSLIVLVFWDKTPLKRIKFLPASLFVVFLGIALNALFIQFLPALVVHPEHLVTIPTIENINSIITFPDFSSIGNYQVWIVAVTIAAIASIETLLNLEAVENIDPRKRRSSPNRELVAQGVGNVVSGLLGGLPITSVVLRGSVNINAGAESKLSAIVHGIFLLISILFLSSVLNLIPLASLAVILIITGYKLAKFSLFKEMYSKGFDQFIPFAATIVAIIFTDLLIGILIGLMISVFYLMKSNFKNPFVLQRESIHTGDTIKIEFPHQVSFLNKAAIRETLWAIPEFSKVSIDATHCNYIDNDVLEIIDDYRTTVSKEKKIKLNIHGLHKHYEHEDQIQFVNVMEKEMQQKLSPDDVLDILKNGNKRFTSGAWSEKNLKLQVAATSEGQNPMAIVLSCIDSRTATEHIFDLGIGDIFSIRIAGNILNSDILGSMEYATHEVGTKLILVLGHTSCGAITGACNHVVMGNLTGLLAKIEPAISGEKTVSDNRSGSNPQFVNQVAALNVQMTIERIRNESAILAALEQNMQIKIVGGLYDIESGRVSFF
jgi:carbonic anhydrase